MIFIACLRKLRSPAIGFPQGFEDGVHAGFFDFANMGHEFAESAFWE